jgi:DNA-binding transcriptional MerR regulator
MFKIGEFSRLANISVRMLRHYEKLGLLMPEVVDQYTGYRYYPARQLAQANRIQQLKALGFSLNTIRSIMEAKTDDEMQKYFDDRKEELERELTDLNFQSTMLERARQIIRKDTHMDYSVVLKEIPSRKVMAFRDKIPGFSDEMQLWLRLNEEKEAQKVSIADPAYGITIFHDSEMRESDHDVEVQVSVEGEYKDNEEVTFYTMPAVQVASVTFNGPFEQTPQVMEAIGTWIEANGYQITGPMFNISHVSPAQDPDPSNWVTESCYQVSRQ